jgi:hypothetical protein
VSQLASYKRSGTAPLAGIGMAQQMKMLPHNSYQPARAISEEVNE